MLPESIAHLYSGREDEQQGLTELCRELAPEEIWTDKECFQSLRIPGTFLFYQKTGERWISFAIGRQFLDEVELFFIYVGKKNRSQGHAKRLLTAFCDYAQGNLQAKKILLEVRAGHDIAQRLYENQGFHRYFRRKSYYANGEDAFLYLLDCKGEK